MTTKHHCKMAPSQRVDEQKGCEEHMDQDGSQETKDHSAMQLGYPTDLVV